MQPLVSICIPTYNRASLLEKTLQHFVDNPEFDDEVELVISDNCSTDATGEVVRRLATERANIRYYRNEENICDRNFIKVLDYGHGAYLKLLNDTEYMEEDALRFVKDTIRENIGKGKPIFFSDHRVFTDAKKPVIECNSVDEYLHAISRFSTSNNIFGAWREDWLALKDKRRYAELKLQQVDWSYQIVHNHHGCIIYDRSIFKQNGSGRKSRSGYNWFQVHLINYYKILEPYVESGEISTKTLRQDKHYFLRHCVSELRRTFHLSKRRGWNFDTTGTWSMLMQHYKYDPYFYVFLLRLPFLKRIR